MSHVPDERLYAHADRVKGKVVVITGAASGIGKETAIKFASFGAKLVIGDLDVSGAQKVVAEIESNGGTAICTKCNVTSWDDQVALFELAVRKYGSVDVVIPNAGVNEIGHLGEVIIKDGQTLPPILKTMEINLTAVLYTAHLAIHYLQIDHDLKSPNSLKALIFIGSIASFRTLPGVDLYSGSKHAVLGVMRALHPVLQEKGIRTGSLHPFFAMTNIVPTSVKLLMAGIPLVPLHRVAGAFILAATDRDWSTNGSAWVLADDGLVFMIPKEEFKLGVYNMIDDRVNSKTQNVSGLGYYRAFVRDLYHTFGRPVVSIGLASFVVRIAWTNKDAIGTYIQSRIA